MTRLLLPLLAALVLLAGPAHALDVAPLAERLQDAPVLVEEGSAVRPDVDAVAERFAELPVPTYAVVLPQALVDAADSGIDGVLLRLVEELDDPRAVVVVVTDGGELQAGEGGTSGVAASAELDRIVQQRSSAGAFDDAALTATLLDFADAVEGGSQEGAERGLLGADRRAVGLAGLLVVALVAAGLLFSRSQRRARAQGPLTDEPPHGSW